MASLETSLTNEDCSGPTVYLNGHTRPSMPDTQWFVPVDQNQKSFKNGMIIQYWQICLNSIKYYQI